MNKLKKGKTIVCWMCFMIGFVSLAIYSLASDFIVIDEEGGGILSAGQASQSGSGSLEEERNALLMESDNNTFTASRGKTNRDKETEPADQAENRQSEITENRLTAIAENRMTASSAKTAADESKPVSGDTARPSVQDAAEPDAAQAAPEVKPAAKPVVKPETKPVAKPETAEKADSEYANDLDLLARLITAEAQGEPYEAKVAVGAVVINRVQSGSWPNTIKAVIYQNIDGYYQFTPVVNGWIDKPAQPESMKAAQAALNGADPTNGSEFYYDDSTTNPWILAKPVSTQIGRMIFAY